MCCFSRPVRHVSQTQIFARPLPGGRQALVYAMSVDLDEDTAMILPLPTPPGAGDEGAVSFVDLSGYGRFFGDLRAAFPEVYLGQPKGGMLLARSAGRPKLAVHAVGEFEASFAPSLGDLDRLDERFRLPRETWARLPRYQDHGFAVFKLRARRWWERLRGRAQTIHPMALTFEPRDRGEIFFPTVHIHDGEVRARAGFDHSLYVQLPGALGQLLDGRWSPSLGPLGSRVDAARSQGLIDGDAPAFRCVLLGEQENTDIVISGPRLRALTTIEGAMLLRLRDQAAGDGAPGWLAARDRFRDALLPPLAALLRGQQAEWGLRPYDRALPVRWMQFDGALPLLPPEAILPSQREPCTLWVPFLDPKAPGGPRGGAHPHVYELQISFDFLPPEATRQALVRHLERIRDEVTASLAAS
jgi:hypothetical protein